MDSGLMSLIEPLVEICLLHLKSPRSHLVDRGAAAFDRVQVR